jgi:hypothetical protein
MWMTRDIRYCREHELEDAEDEGWDACGTDGRLSEDTLQAEMV